MTSTTTNLPPLIDVADFIDGPGDGLGTRFELIDGVSRAMAPGSDAHNTIVMTLGRLIGNHLAKRRPGCRVVAAPGVQPRIRAEWNFRIPDLGVTCAPNRPGEISHPIPYSLSKSCRLQTPAKPMRVSAPMRRCQAFRKSWSCIRRALKPSFYVATPWAIGRPTPQS